MKSPTNWINASSVAMQGGSMVRIDKAITIVKNVIAMVLD